MVNLGILSKYKYTSSYIKIIGRLVWLFLVFLWIVFFVSACGKKTEYTNEITIEIPGISREYNYFLLNDTHIFIGDEEIKEESNPLVVSRINEFSLDGLTSAQNFEKWILNLDEKNLDGVILNADIEDQLSRANLKFVDDTLNNLKVPYMYLMSDHDYATDWTVLSEEDAKTVNEIVSSKHYDAPISVFEEDDIIILGMNKSWQNISEDTLAKIKEIFNKNKPVILITHVPYNSVISDDLSNLSRRLKGDRVLLWGNTGVEYYVPNEPMAEFLTMISATDSPVVAIVGAHLHDTYTTMFNEQIPEYILGTGYSGVRTLLKIVPKE